jgi:exopolysaccharide biosynthesis polyprenyl glycosylphosphotransferase
VSTPFLSPRPHKPQELDWARLIPGETPAFRSGRKKPVRPARTFAPEEAPEMWEESASAGAKALALLLPRPLQGRMAWMWARSAATDVALVGLDWLLLGALLVPLHRAFPQVRGFGFAASRPFSLLGIAILHAVLITLVGNIEGLYATGAHLRQQTRTLCKSLLCATAVLCFVYGMQGAPWTTGGLIWVAGVLHGGALLAWRWQRDKQQLAEDHRGDLRNVLIVGAGGTGRRVAAFMEGHPESGRKVYGILDDERPLRNGVIGRISDLARLARTGFVDEVILAAPHDRSLTLQILHEARRLRLDVKMVPELFGCASAGSEVERVGDFSMICLHAERSPAAGLALKRIVDVAGAGLALMVLTPMLAVIAGLIKLDSPGAVLYRAQRAGRKGRLFRCYKFRTMVSNADELKIHLRQDNQRAGPFFKIARDPRITRLGRFLRRYSLDELPQFWNVVRGDMSLVGPRPHPVDDFAAYEIGHLARLDVTPGITGLWQVTARRDPSFERGMALDREYIRTWSLGTDLRILLKTVMAVARGSGD